MKEGGPSDRTMDLILKVDPNVGQIDEQYTHVQYYYRLLERKELNNIELLWVWVGTVKKEKVINNKFQKKLYSFRSLMCG